MGIEPGPHGAASRISEELIKLAGSDQNGGNPKKKKKKLTPGQEGGDKWQCVSISVGGSNNLM